MISLGGLFEGEKSRLGSVGEGAFGTFDGDEGL